MWTVWIIHQLYKMKLLFERVVVGQKTNHQFHFRHVKTQQFSTEMSIQAVKDIICLSLTLHHLPLSVFRINIFPYYFFLKTSWDANIQLSTLSLLTSLSLFHFLLFQHVLGLNQVFFFLPPSFSSNESWWNSNRHSQTSLHIVLGAIMVTWLSEHYADIAWI